LAQALADRHLHSSIGQTSNKHRDGLMTLLGQKVGKWGERAGLAAGKARSASLGLTAIDSGDDGDASIELMEGLIRQRLKMFEPHVEKWMQMCRDWQPEQGLPSEVVTAVRSLLDQVNKKARPVSTVIAVAAAKRWRKAVSIAKIRVPKALAEDDHEHLPPITPRRPSTLSPSAALGGLKDRQASPIPLFTPSLPPSPRAPSRFSPSHSGAPKGSFRWQVQKEHTLSSEITDLLRNFFLTRLCDALHSTAQNLAKGDTDWTFVYEGVKLLNWLCRQSAPLRSFCEQRLIIQTLIRFCEEAPPADITMILTLLFALRTFLCTSVASQEVQLQRVAEAADAHFFGCIVKRIRLWMDAAILLARKKEKAGNQVLDCLHDLVVELLKHESMRNAAVDSDFVPLFTNLIRDRLLSEPLVWPRSLPLLMDAVTALPRAEYIECGIELNKVLRHAHIHKGIDTLPSVLSLRMNSLRQRGQTPEGSQGSCRNSLTPRPQGSRRHSLAPTPAGSRCNSLTPTPEGSEQGDFQSPRAPAGPSPTCRCPLTANHHRHRRKSDSSVLRAKRRKGSEPAVSGRAHHPEEGEAVCEPPALPEMSPPHRMSTSLMLE